MNILQKDDYCGYFLPKTGGLAVCFYFIAAFDKCWNISTGIVFSPSTMIHHIEIKQLVQAESEASE